MGDKAIFGIDSAVQVDVRHESGERHLAELLRDGILVANEVFHPIWMNSALRQMLNLDAEAIPESIQQILEICGNTSELSDEIIRACNTLEGWSGEVLVLPGGVLTETSLDIRRDGNRWVLVFSNYIGRNAEERRLRREALRDSLTGLPNRSVFQEHLYQMMTVASNSKELLAIMFIDLDRFKIINDGLGHMIGDALLKAAAFRIGSILGAHSTLYRLGGDEFVVVTHSTSREQAKALGEEIRRSMLVPFAVESYELSVTCSIGASFYPDHGSDISALLKHSDVALYEAKQNGRNHMCIYSEELSRRAVRDFEIENGLRTAIQKNELSLEYQLQVDASEKCICGAEALLRWNSGQLGKIPPDIFIPVAEQLHIISNISDWVVDTASRQLAEWRKTGVPIPKVAVNLSCAQLTDMSLPERLAEIVARNNIQPAMIELELTESAVMRDFERSCKIVKGLRTRGFSISVDDFGTGYSSLSYLKHLPINKIKIDRSFVSGIPFDQGDIALSKGIISLARSLGLEPLAEGVETLEQMHFMWVNQCTKIQGYVFAKPAPPEGIPDAIEHALAILAGKTIL